MLGLDVGERRIGVALSDPLGLTAGPLPAIDRISWKKDLARIRELIGQFEIGRVVIGLPLRMDGSPGEEAERMLEFVSRLQATIRIPVTTWDERLTTREAERRLVEADVRRERRRRLIDGIAACLILQGYLDFRSSGREGE